MLPRGAPALLHGGDRGAARKLFPDAPQPFIDLSTGINPHSYPVPDLPAELFAWLPEPDAMARLVTAAAAAYGAPSPDCVVAAPGTQILLPLVAALVPPGRAVIFAPTYAEFRRATALAGHRVAEVTHLDPSASTWPDLRDADLIVVVNPNNPDGRICDRDALLTLAEAQHRRGGLLLVDEAFMDVGPLGTSVCGDVGRAPIVVLRSFGKFFGLAGVRLGFAVAAPERAVRLAAALGPWAVSGPAMTIGETALADTAWIRGMRERLVGAAHRLDGLLAGAGVTVLGGTSLFRLVHTPAADCLFRQLGAAGIFLRRFPEHSQWLRFGLPEDEAAWLRLAAALTRFGRS
jgi:cobalamin biosynthesis protein CobC